MKKKFLFACGSLLLCCCLLATNAAAASLSLTDANTSVSGWAYSTQQGHMGTKSSTYTFESSAVQSSYETDISNGIALWGSNISLRYTGQSSAAGIISQSDSETNATASLSVVNCDSNGHRTNYILTIYKLNFDSNSSAMKTRTIAHEIGHAYGLGHVSTSTDIMYGTASATKSVTSQAIWGIKVVTHVHTHSSTTTGTYEQYNSSYHYVTCSSCLGIYQQAHTYSSGKCSKCGYSA